MQINHLVTGALLATLSFFSCSSDETISISEEPIKLSAFINGPNSRIGSAWEGREKLGLFMTNSGESFMPVVKNKMFNVTANGTLSPSDGNQLLYPVDGSKVQFVSYYPYASVGEDYIYKIDFADTTIADHDLLYTELTGEYDKTNKDAVQLNFKHQLSKLTLTIQDENGVNLVDFDAKITIPTKADFNIETGNLTITADSEQELAVQVGNGVASALVLPGSASGKIVFTSAEKSFTWDISTITLEPGKNYAYTLKLIPTTDPDNNVEVIGQANIIDWGTVDGGNIDLEEDGSGTNPETPDYSGNIDLSLTTLTEKAYKEKLIIADTEYPCIKIGTSSLGGKCTSTTIGAGKTKIKFYAFSWKGQNGVTLNVISSNGATKTYTLESNDGLTGNNPYIVTMPEGAQPHVLEIEASDEATTITFDSTVAGKRVVFFGLNAE